MVMSYVFKQSVLDVNGCCQEFKLDVSFTVFDKMATAQLSNFKLVLFR